jgi:hypothetical protein
MASRTQLRLGQITGSLGDFEGGIVDTLAADAGANLGAVTLNSGSLVGVFSAIASSLTRLHGGNTFANNDISTLKDIDGSSRIVFTADNGIVFNQEDGNAAALTVGSSTADDKLVLFGGNAKFADAGAIGSTTTVDLVTLNANDVQIKAGKDLLVDEILESTSAAGVTIDGVLIKDNDIIIPDGSTIGSVTTPAAITVAGNGNITASQNVTVTGDLTVNGTTTTLDTTNLLVEDVVIGMAANASGQNQNGGLAIFSGSSDSDLVFGRVANDVWGAGKKATLKGEVTTLADMTLVNLRASTFEISGVDDTLGIDAGTGNLTLDSSAALVLSSSGDVIEFSDGSNTLLTLDNGFSHSLLGSLTIDGNGSNPGALILKDADDSNQVTLKAPGTVSANYELLLPGAIGSGNQVLRLNSGATALEFADVSAAGNTKKAVRVIASTIAAEANVDMDTNEADHDDFGAGALAALVGSANVVDVFVNGQLMTTGSVAQITGAERDYRITTGNILNFSFNLEADDVVQVITRG